jgi:hypothetical protein
MAQTSVSFGGVSKQSPAELAHKQLEIEKVGVIVGFLAGLPLAVGPVGEFLASHGASNLVVDAGMFLTVALTTAGGLRIGAALASLLGARK